MDSYSICSFCGTSFTQQDYFEIDVAYINSPFLFSAECSVVLNWCICSPGRYLGFFWFEANTSKVAVNVHINGFLWTYVSLRGQ